MADNVQLSTNIGEGDKAVAAAVTFSGDASKVFGSFLGIISGTAESYVFTLCPGGAGAVDGGTPRVTLASDDPAVVALQIIDDWDESDRAKVNLIVGQAGITAGAGAVAANTPRVTHASDDPAVTALQIVDDWDETDRAKTNAALDSSKVISGGVVCTPKFAVIDHASSGDNTLVTGVSNKKIRVLSLFLVSAGTVTARFESGASGTALSGQMNLVANSGFSLPFNPAGWFETAASALLNLELSGAVSVDGSLTYIEVD